MRICPTDLLEKGYPINVLDEWLATFVLETRRPDGKFPSPESEQANTSQANTTLSSSGCNEEASTSFNSSGYEFDPDTSYSTDGLEVFLNLAKMDV